MLSKQVLVSFMGADGVGTFEPFLECKDLSKVLEFERVYFEIPNKYFAY